MAARKRRTTLNDKWRERIRTSMLINRLENHILGEIELSASQVTAALGLLKKTAPDLQAAQITQESVVRYVVDTKPMPVDEWQNKYARSGDLKPDPSTH